MTMTLTLNVYRDIVVDQSSPVQSGGNLHDEIWRDDLDYINTDTDTDHINPDMYLDLTQKSVGKRAICSRRINENDMPEILLKDLSQYQDSNFNGRQPFWSSNCV